VLATKKQLAATTRDTEKEQLQRKCDYIDGEIDKLVWCRAGGADHSASSGQALRGARVFRQQYGAYGFMVWCTAFMRQSFSQNVELIIFSYR
jgi:hypothetical protein